MESILEGAIGFPHYYHSLQGQHVATEMDIENPLHRGQVTAKMQRLMYEKQELTAKAIAFVARGIMAKGTVSADTIGQLTGTEGGGELEALGQAIMARGMEV